jgi:hypothetical protein
VGLASKVKWGQQLVSGDVDVKPRDSSRPRGWSVNDWLRKADLGLALCGSGMLILQPRDVVRRALTRVYSNVT